MSKYKRVRLTRTITRDEHRLVMEAHLGRELLSNELVHHRDGDKSNNKFSNLVLTTRSKHFKTHEPEIRAKARPPTELFKRRLSAMNSHEKHPQAKLNWGIVADIRRRAGAGEKSLDIADSLGLSNAIVRQVIYNERWKREEWL